MLYILPNDYLILLRILLTIIDSSGSYHQAGPQAISTITLGTNYTHGKIKS